MNDLELKKNKIMTVVKIVSMVITGFLVAPFVFIAIKGLLGLLIAGVVSFIIINFIPWFALKIANWRLKALKHEASKNPIETLENQYQLREEALVQFRENITRFHAEVKNFYTRKEEHKQRYPEQGGKFDEQYNQMRQLLDARSRKYVQAQQNLKRFADMIEQKRSEWEVAKAAASMSQAAGMGEEFINKLMADTAVESVTTNLNLAFAELETSLLDEVASAAPQKVVIESQPVAQLPEKSGPPTLDLGFDVDYDRVEVKS
jgi:hypothetical protein